QAAVAEAAQVGDDDLEAGVRQRGDVARPDPLRLRPAVDEQQRRAALALAPEGQLDAVADLGPVHREHARILPRRGRPYPPAGCPTTGTTRARSSRAGSACGRTRGPGSCRTTTPARASSPTSWRCSRT